MGSYKYQRVTKENLLTLQTKYDDFVEVGYILVAPFGTRPDSHLNYELLSEASFNRLFTPTGKKLLHGFFEAEENDIETVTPKAPTQD